MSIPLTINGAVFNYPQSFDEDWGVDATGWAQAVTAGALYLSGGSFPLTNTVDFGSSFGIKVKSILSKTANPAAAGYLGLAKTDAIEWRNNANTGNLALTIDGSDMLSFNGSPLGLTSLTNAHIYVGNASNVPVDVAMSGDITIGNTGVTAISSGVIVNADINASAAIARTKIAAGTPGRIVYNALVTGAMTDLIALTPSRVMATDTDGLPYITSATAAEGEFLSGVTSAIQTQLNARLPLAGGTMSGAINMASHKLTAVTQGSNTGEAIAFPVDTAQVAAHAITQVQSSVSGSSADQFTTITTQAITTTGGPVIILAQADVNGVASGAGIYSFTVAVTRGGTSVVGGESVTSQTGLGTLATFNIGTNITAIDTPAAGTYTYNFTYVLTTGTSPAIARYSFVLLELKR